ncbi:class I SAM-dependent methyltransferase [Aeromonas veronii]|uniref:class I SAM-dependent methyltransferase n=1 Tax=Aeromonas veronii TaxID=654 RepID=UPI001116040B|nr:class I SAM-dependent methyltransferase [Aeromonas veronii]
MYKAQIADSVTEGLHIDKACEIGVHRGDFSDFMLRQIPLNSLYLVDKWSSQEIVNNFSPFDEMPFYITDRLDGELMNSFFDGSPYEQETIEKHYQYTAERFANDSRVKIIRESSFDALSHFKPGELDLIYIDANHQYEFILRDLMT